MAGGICMIKFVLTSLPLFYLLNVSCSCGSDERTKKGSVIVSLRLRFGGEENSLGVLGKKCTGREFGGIDNKHFNYALLGKWI